MNVLIINDFAFIEGGASKVAINSAIALAARGINVIFFTAVGPVCDELRYSNVITVSTNQYDILRDPKRLRAIKQGIWNFKAENMLKNILSKLDSTNTVIHLHSWTKALSSSVVKVALSKGFKIVCTLHSYYIACPNGGFFNYPRNEICNVKPMSIECCLTNCDSRSYPQKCWRLMRQVAQKYFGKIPNGIKYYITISEFSRDILTPFIPKDAKMFMVPNPIDVIKRDRVTAENNDYFAFVGRISKEKGPLIFAEAVTRANSKGILIGDGECAEEIKLRYPSIEQTGWVKSAEVLECLQKARALVFPSLWYEGQPLVIREAASMGIPAIVSSNCAARDLIKNGINGLEFQNGNIDELVYCINQIKQDTIARQMSIAAYTNYWSNPYTIGKHVDDLLSIYEQVLT